MKSPVLPCRTEEWGFPQYLAPIYDETIRL